MHKRYQRVVLNGPTSSWELVKSEVPQGSVIGSLFILTYINDFPGNLESICKIFADGVSLFSNVFDNHVSRATINKDLELINNWAFQWKMQFNPDQNKQAQELYFSQKTCNKKLLVLTFNKSNGDSFPSVKHLAMLLHSRLNFNEHVQSKKNICYKMIGLIKKSSIHLPREVLLWIYMSFVKPNLDDGDKIFDKPDNESLNSRIESRQYKACIAITGAIHGKSLERFYRELDLVSSSDRCWFFEDLRFL